MFKSQEELHIAGVVIRCSPDRFLEVVSSLGTREGVEVHQVAESEGVVIATVETPRLETQVDVTKALLDIQGVVDVDLVYHAFEHIDSRREEVIGS